MSIHLYTDVDKSGSNAMHAGDWMIFKETTTYTDANGVEHDVFTKVSVTSVRDPETNAEKTAGTVGLTWTETSDGKYFVPGKDVEAVVEFTYYYEDTNGVKVDVSLTDAIVVSDIDGKSTGGVETVGVSSGSNFASYTLGGDGVQGGGTNLKVDTSVPGDWYFTANTNNSNTDYFNDKGEVQFDFTNQSSNTLIFSNSSAGGLFIQNSSVTGTPVTIPKVIPGGVCFCRDTMIKTEDGYELIQDLKIGDKVVTKDHGVQAIKWVGFTTVNLKKREYAPVVFEAGSILGNSEAISVSPNHRFVLAGPRLEIIFGEQEVLIEAKYLVDGDKVRIDDESKSVEYYHVMFDDHEIIYCANDIETESFLATSYSVSLVDQNVQNEILELFPELASENATEVAPARQILTKSDALVALSVG